MVFITVKHGANEQTIFNRDCRCVTLLYAIREKCCSGSNATIIDLSDKEGNVKNLRKYPNMTAKEVLTEREDVVLLKVGQNEKGKLVYTPLLESEEIVTKAFLDKLAKGSKRESSKSSKSASALASSKSQAAPRSPTPGGGSRGKGGGTPQQEPVTAATSNSSSFGKKSQGLASQTPVKKR